MRRAWKIPSAVVVLAAVLFLGDYAWLRLRAGRNQGAYDAVQVEIVMQIPQKGNKAEYVPQEPQMQSCVRSLFPHEGQPPCWYLRRHRDQQINY